MFNKKLHKLSISDDWSVPRFQIQLSQQKYEKIEIIERNSYKISMS